MRIHLKPFRLGLRCYSFGVLFKWRGLWRAIGPNYLSAPPYMLAPRGTHRAVRNGQLVWVKRGHRG